MTSPALLELLERAVRERHRLAFRRRGTEYVVVALDLDTSGRREILVCRIPMTGEEMAFSIDELSDVAIVP